MSILYKEKKDIEYAVNITEIDGKIVFEFTCDGGKHGTIEVISDYTLTPKQLLDIFIQNDILTNELPLTINP